MILPSSSVAGLPNGAFSAAALTTVKRHPVSSE
jgi:hypothetical protein